MAVEIERKYLLKNDDWRFSVEKSIRMKQRYLPFQDGTGSGRVRIAGDQAFLTMKTQVKGFSRQEFEYEIPLDDAESILAYICSGPVIEKIRHYIPFEGFLWEVDEFCGENTGLILAEIELQSEKQTFPIPSWIGVDVTGDARYFNSVLAEHPFCSWKT